VNTMPDNHNFAHDKGERSRAEQRDNIRQLGLRIGGKTPGPPPWAWPNLSATEAAILDGALDEFVHTYNRIYAGAVDKVIPRCWRKHPPLAQEMPVQFWAWWGSNIDVRATIPLALDYHSRSLPSFKSRLADLLGKGAVTCRKGTHVSPSDPELIAAISFPVTSPAEETDRGEATRRTLHRTDFGTFEGVTE